MKNLFPLVLLSAVLAVSACDETTSVKEDVLKDAKNFEDGVSNVTEYNDGLVSNVSLLQAEWQKLDRVINSNEFDLTNDDFNKKYSSAHSAFMNEYNRVKSALSSVSPIGKGGAEYRVAALGCINAYGELGALVAPNNLSLAILEQDEKYFDDYDRAFEKVIEAENGYIAANKSFASKNNRRLEKSIDIEELAK